MRKDMGKVIAETPRHLDAWRTCGNKNERCPSKRMLASGKEDELPTKSSMRKTGDSPGKDKDWSFRYPLIRDFLRAQVGKKWDDVYSEIKSTIPINTKKNFKIVQALSEWYISAANKIEILDGKPFLKAPGGRHCRNCTRHPVAGVYVDPRDGIIKYRAEERKAKPTKPVVCIIGDKNVRYVKHERRVYPDDRRKKDYVISEWMRVTLAPIADYKLWVPPHERIQEVWQKLPEGSYGYVETLVRHKGFWTWPTDKLHPDSQFTRDGNEHNRFYFYKAKDMFAIKAEACNTKDLERIKAALR